MSWMGSVLTAGVQLDASSPNIPGSASNSEELIAVLSKEVSSIHISTNIASPFWITLGAAGSEEDWFLVSGYATTVHDVPRMPIHASKGMRVGIRAYGTGAITSGTVTVNLWS